MFPKLENKRLSRIEDLKNSDSQTWLKKKQIPFLHTVCLTFLTFKCLGTKLSGIKDTMPDTECFCIAFLLTRMCRFPNASSIYIFNIICQSFNQNIREQFTFMCQLQSILHEIWGFGFFPPPASLLSSFVSLTPMGLIPTPHSSMEELQQKAQIKSR